MKHTTLVAFASVFLSIPVLAIAEPVYVMRPAIGHRSAVLPNDAFGANSTPGTPTTPTTPTSPPLPGENTVDSDGFTWRSSGFPNAYTNLAPRILKWNKYSQFHFMLSPSFIVQPLDYNDGQNICYVQQNEDSSDRWGESFFEVFSDGTGTTGHINFSKTGRFGILVTCNIQGGNALWARQFDIEVVD